jgi:hypothetical protein
MTRPFFYAQVTAKRSGQHCGQANHQREETSLNQAVGKIDGGRVPMLGDSCP